MAAVKYTTTRPNKKIFNTFNLFCLTLNLTYYRMV